MLQILFIIPKKKSLTLGDFFTGAIAHKSRLVMKSSYESTKIQIVFSLSSFLGYFPG